MLETHEIKRNNLKVNLSEQWNNKGSECAVLVGHHGETKILWQLNLSHFFYSVIVSSQT